MTALPPVVILAPEGVPLRFGAAAASERLVAFTMDLAILLLLTLFVGVGLGLTFGRGAVLLAMFLLRQGYFVYCETRQNGSTPGKRRLHLRVVRADGGPLSTGILIARNLSREVEFFLPLSLLLQPDALFAEHQGFVRLLASAWVLGLLFFPLLTPERLRIGDLLAGTRVVVSPPAPLLTDLADARVAAEQPKAERFQFRAAQLGIYGEHELQVLEGLLRKVRAAGGDSAVAAVVDKIVARIGWEGEPIAAAEQLAFLRAFYAAQRRHLEDGLLLGRRRARKQPKAATQPKAPPPR
jgi:uncharacterized RDD family membrane protein YckC